MTVQGRRTETFSGSIRLYNYYLGFKSHGYPEHSEVNKYGIFSQIIHFKSDEFGHFRILFRAIKLRNINMFLFILRVIEIDTLYYGTMKERYLFNLFLFRAFLTQSKMQFCWY